MDVISLVIGVVIGFVIIAARQSSDYRMSRNALINATPATLFEHVNNLQKWPAWSPWAKMDPEAKITFAGPEAGKDAQMSWEGKKTGIGTMTVVESIPGERVTFRLDFKKPMIFTQSTEFGFAPEGGKTRVFWSMQCTSPLFNRLMGLAMNCDKMICKQFDAGLKNLQDIVEK